MSATKFRSLPMKRQYYLRRLLVLLVSAMVGLAVPIGMAWRVSWFDAGDLWQGSTGYSEYSDDVHFQVFSDIEMPDVGFDYVRLGIHRVSSPPPDVDEVRNAMERAFRQAGGLQFKGHATPLIPTWAAKDINEKLALGLSGRYLFVQYGRPFRTMSAELQGGLAPNVPGILWSSVTDLPTIAVADPRWPRAYCGNSQYVRCLPMTPIWPTFALVWGTSFVAAYIALSLLLSILHMSTRRIVGFRRRRRGLCADCGYSLKGLLANACPECGWVRRASGRRERSAAPRS